jgi:hypothetical protein
VSVRASDIEAKAPPACPTCGKPMRFYGGTSGFICCEWKLLAGDCWLDARGEPSDQDTRLAKDLRRR